MLRIEDIEGWNLSIWIELLRGLLTLPFDGLFSLDAFIKGASEIKVLNLAPILSEVMGLIVNGKLSLNLLI